MTNIPIDEVFRVQVRDYNIFDNDTPMEQRKTILNQYHLRTFDRTNGCYYTYSRNSHSQITYDFNELKKELLEMRELIINDPIFESRWVSKVPQDILK